MTELLNSPHLKNSSDFISHFHTIRENKYVAEMRSSKKVKRTNKSDNQNDESPRNFIEPW